MIVGIEKFREHFADYRGCYTLIGGTAAYFVLNEAGLDARATKDLDIVLVTEAMTPEFGQAFWTFVTQGRYQIQEASTGEKRFYRFQKPAAEGYPSMLELFSNIPDALELEDDSHLTPIPIDEAVSSLSAILLNDDYYRFLLANTVIMDGVSIVNETCLIPLKARAWLDLSQRKEQGETIDSKNIKKHRSDVMRLYQLLDLERNEALPAPIQEDMRSFLEQVEPLLNAGYLKQLGLTEIAPIDILLNLQRYYGIV